MMLTRNPLIRLLYAIGIPSLLIQGCGGNLDPLEVTPTSLPEFPTATPSGSTETPVVVSPTPDTPVVVSPTPETPQPEATPTASPVPTATPIPATPTPEPPTPTASPEPNAWPIPSIVDPEMPWRAGAMLVSDTGSGRLSVVRMLDSALLWDYSANVSLPSICTSFKPCQVHETQYVVDQDSDMVDFVTSSGDQQWSSLHRVRLDNPSKPVFNIMGYDWTAVPSSGCRMTAEQSCKGGANIDPQCQAWFAHAFQHVEDDRANKKLTTIIADHHGRIFQTRLDYSKGSECGKVEWMLDYTTVGWDSGCQANDIQRIVDNDTEYLLVTCRNMNTNAGQGKIQLLEHITNVATPYWKSVWNYPDATSGQLPYLNTPHHARVTQREDGGYTLRYAHSDGLGTDWAAGDNGSLGFATLLTLRSQPDYLADYYSAIDGENLDFKLVKSVEPMPGNVFLVTDGGEEYFNTPSKSPAFVVGLPESVNDNVPGYWTASLSQQHLVKLDNPPLSTYACGWNMLYNAYYLAPAQLGKFLRDANESEGIACRLSPKSMGLE